MELVLKKPPVYEKDGVPYFGSEEAGDQFDATDVESWSARFAERWREKGQADDYRNAVWMDLCKQAAALNLPVMDIACGPGLGLLPDIYAFNPSMEAVATDACPLVVEAWQRFMKENAPAVNIGFASFDAANMPLASNSIDVMTSHIGFGSLRRAGADQLDGIREAYRVLKPGGRIFTIELEFEDRAVIQQVFDKWGRTNWFEKDQLTWRERFESVGFTVAQENFLCRRMPRDWELGDVAASFGLEIWAVTKAYVLCK
ncbi:MAG: class I SAM-dependent methyltransferase [Defluviitaleaceae bacterium]|nr:class I SAM-dependent methyltransferase [Defluviitaleaceae bacterium]